MIREESVGIPPLVSLAAPRFGFGRDDRGKKSCDPLTLRESASETQHAASLRGDSAVIQNFLRMGSDVLSFDQRRRGHLHPSARKTGALRGPRHVRSMSLFLLAGSERHRQECVQSHDILYTVLSGHSLHSGSEVRGQE